MTMYRKLKRSPTMVRKGSVYSGFAGLCALLMVGCAIAGFAMSTKGATTQTVDLVAHSGTGTYEWRVLDRNVDPNTAGAFSLRKPAATSDGGLSFAFNDVSADLPTDLYTVYMVWYGKMDLSEAASISAEISTTYSGTDAPMLVCRRPFSPYDAWHQHELTPDGSETSTDVFDSSGNLIYFEPFVRLFFQSPNGDSWTCSDYWWSTGDAGVEFSYFTFDPLTKTMSCNLVVPLNDLSSWSDRDGHFASGTYAGIDHSVLFSDALANAQEIGLSFGGYANYANGVGVFDDYAETVTFELENYVIAW